MNKARIITFANNKGGCGKTTTAVNFAAALRGSGRDVLAVDMDGQANLTACFGIPTGGASMFDALKDPAAPPIVPVRVMNPADGAGVLDVLPASADLSAVEAGLVSEPDRLTRLRAYLEPYRGKYDCIIIDTPPAVGLLTIGALFASDETIITTQPQPLAVRGIISLRDAVETLNRGGARVGSVRVLFCQFDRRKALHRITAEQVQAAGFDVFRTKIRDNVALGEASGVGLDVFRYAPKSNGAADYAAFLDEYQSTKPIKHTKHAKQ